MSLIRWNPIRDLDFWFGHGPFASDPASAGDWRPPVDILETEADFRIDMELPAIDRESLSVTVKDAVLTVSGERKQRALDDIRNHRLERRYGAFSRSFRLPDTVDADSISAASREGVLSLTIAKREPDGPKSIEVQVH